MTKYYLAGGGRVAMRMVSATSSELTYQFGDQLSSTSATYRMSDGNVVHQLYKPWGEVRYASASLTTQYTYTGQYSYTDDLGTPLVTEGFGLMFYNARWLDPQLGRWNQPDTVIPEQSQGVQAWDRYAYVNNNPLKYIDPSGHDVGYGGRNADGSPYSTSNDLFRQDYLFSLIFMGSGENGSWTKADWDYYNSNRNSLWNDPSSWKNSDPEEGWNLFAVHVNRLASHYTPTEKRQFVKDFSLVFGGISAERSWLLAAYDARHGPILPFLNEGNEGLDPQYADSLNTKSNQSHHFAGLFFLSYHIEIEAAIATNYSRDSDNQGDILLGNQAAQFAYFFRYYSANSAALAGMISYLGGFKEK